MRGAAIECRIYAEDPGNNFFPSPGRILRLRTPSGPGIRDDGGVYEGWTVPIDYDPLLSKLVAWGSTRAEAIARMRRALREYHIDGIKSNIGFFQELLGDREFLSGDFDTGFIDRWQKSKRAALPETAPADRPLAAIAAALFHSERAIVEPAGTKAAESLWKLDARRRGLRSS
jgi:acetyl-CoA carboxylase biotin carboxylase subunit